MMVRFHFWRVKYRLIGLVGRVFTNGLGDLGSIPGRVTPKTLKKKKMELDTSLLNTQQYIEQVLAATSHKAPTIRPPASHHENYTS